MSAHIHAIQTAVPDRQYSQEYAAGKMKQWLGAKSRPRVIDRLYGKSGIRTRHSAVSEFGGAGSAFPETGEGLLEEPGTEARNDIFARESRRLAVDAARKVIEEGGFSPGDVTHVVFVTCTGFSNPGVDYYLVRDLELQADTQRYVLGFMGCYAALPALRMAHQFCAANAAAVVLVVSVELCTLHLQVDGRPDSMLANALFADGAGAAIVSARAPAGRGRKLELLGFDSALLSDGEQDMAWRIGDRGFIMNLSSYVPKVIGAGIGPLVNRVLAGQGLSADDVAFWAVHPGGTAILEKIERELDLQPAALASSRKVLEEYGNMSSATTLFVLNEILRSANGTSGALLAAAFGPGLTVETAVMRLAPHNGS